MRDLWEDGFFLVFVEGVSLSEDEESSCSREVERADSRLKVGERVVARSARRDWRVLVGLREA